MTDEEELGAIEARYLAVLWPARDAQPERPVLMTLATEDVPRLVAEIRRLRTTLADIAQHAEPAGKHEPVLLLRAVRAWAETALTAPAAVPPERAEGPPAAP